MKDCLINFWDLFIDIVRFISKLKLVEYFYSDDEEENIIVIEINFVRNKYNLNFKNERNVYLYIFLYIVCDIF